MESKLSYYTGIPENIFAYAEPEGKSSNYHFLIRANHTIHVWTLSQLLFTKILIENVNIQTV